MRRKLAWWFLGLVAFFLLGAYALQEFELLSVTILPDRLGWLLLLLWGAAVMGAVFEPLVKELFPRATKEDVAKNPARLLRDYETLSGYYPVACIAILLGSLLAGALFLEDAFALADVASSPAFFTAALISGVINIFIFYFGTKALRYGDLSLVSMTAGLSPLLTLPISFIVFQVFAGSAPLESPNVSLFGLVGILLIVSGLILNVFADEKQKETREAPEGDWFAHHPVLSGMLAATLGSVALNFDKVAVEAGNPFLFSIVVTGVVALGTIAFGLIRNGLSRLLYLWKTHGRSFIIVGTVYGALVLVMAITLWGENVNYQGAIKRLSIIFATLYGAYVLFEGGTLRAKLIRIAVAIAAVLGIVLITVFG